MELVYPAMVNQTYTDIRIIAQIVSDDGGCENYIRQNFPNIEVLHPGYNIGFARGHNEIFASSDSEYYQLVNPDVILEPDYVAKLVSVFSDPRVGAATGKLLRYDFEHKTKTNIFDTTGITMSHNGRARDRGQHEEDRGQYNGQAEIIGVSGAAPMYRKSALEAVKLLRSDGRFEYFDEDFHSYWEDVDLSLRLQHAGFTARFVPEALGYHGRTAGSSEKGYKDVAAFVKHHKQYTSRVRQLNFKNHIFTVIKNFPTISWKFFVREVAMLGYIVLFEISTLKVIPEMWRQMKAIRLKRKWIMEHSKNKTWTTLLNNKGVLG